MKKLLLIGLLVIFCMSLTAKTMKDMWLSMPDNLMSYLDKSHRLELVDYIGMKVKSEVINTFKENCVMDTITNDYTSVRLNASSRIQMKILKGVDGDSVLCLVKTLEGPEPESMVSFFALDWKQLDIKMNLNDYISSMIVKPDTLSQSVFDKFKSKINLCMVEAVLSQTTCEMTLKLSVPLVFRDDKSKINAIFMQRKLKWNGKIFN